MADINKLKDALVAAHNAGDVEAAKIFADEIKSMQQAIPSPTEGMSSGELFLAGVGKGMTDIGRGIGQRLGMVSEQDVARAKQLDQPLMETTAGTIGNVIGSVAPALPTAFIPGVNTYTGAAALGATMGALQPTVEGESPVVNAAIGAPLGMAGQFAGNMITRGANATINAVKPIASKVKNLITNPIPTSVNVNVKVQNALKESGVNFGDLSPDIQKTISADVENALKLSPNLSKDALRRLVDYRLTGATPRTAQLTLDPAQITQQKNLAKLGVNSKDVKAQQLAQVENQNNQILLNKFDELGAQNSSGDLYGAGENVYNSAGNFLNSKKQGISGLYNYAQNIGGRTAEFDNVQFVNKVGTELDKSLKNAFLPTEIRNIVNDVAQGKLPLNVQTAEQLKTIVAASQRASTDGNVKQALSIVREALDNTPLKPNQGLGNDALKAFNQARKETLAFKKLQEKTPILKNIEDGIEPDKIFEKHIVRSNLNEFKNTLGVLDSASKQQLKNDVIAYIKNAATRNQPNETAKVSADALNRVIGSNGVINNKKLSLLFTKDELAAINAIKNVARYETFQPVGSAVNNSNTASAALNILDRLSNAPLLSKIPLGRSLIAEPLTEINLAVQSGRALNVPRGIVQDTIAQPTLLRNRLSPVTGLLSAELGNQ